MKQFFPAVVIIVVFVFVTGCGVCKPPQPTVIVRDSLVFRDRIIHDTTTFTIEKEVEKIVTRDTTSHLENDYAKSDAMVSRGLLSHSLESIPQVIKVPYEVVVTDTLIVHKEAETVIKEVKVEKELTWWQRFRMGAFWWLVGLALIGWRREIIKLIKMFL